MMQNDYLLVLSTCPSEEVAQQIAQHLVEQHLAACVNVLPKATSVYMWQGEIQTASEAVLLIKTQTECYAALEQALETLHPYDVPEIIAVPIQQGLDIYLAWIKQNTH